MATHGNEQQERQLIGPITPQKVAIASAVTLIAEPALALTHAGGIGVIAGLAAGALSYLIADEIEQSRGKETSLPHVPAPSGKVKEPGQPSLLYRAFNGKSARDEGRDGNESVYSELPSPTPLPSPVVSEESEDSSMQALIKRLAQYMDHAYARPHSKRPMRLAPNFNPDVDEIGGLGILIAGIKGSGKTVLGTRLAEQFAPYYIPMSIFDKEGDLLSTISHLRMGKIVGCEERSGHYPWDEWGVSQHERFIGITDEDSAYQVGYDIFEEGYQAIFDLQAWKKDEDRAFIMIGVINGMMAWANENPKGRVPSLIFLDEAAHWIPEEKELSKLTPTTLARLTTAFTETAQMGRKRGLIQVYMCQRISGFKKSVMAESDMYIFGRARLDNDLTRYMHYIDPATLGFGLDVRGAKDKAKKVLASLGSGQFVVCMPDGTQFVSCFYERESKHISHTPKAQQAEERYAPKAGAASASVPQIRIAQEQPGYDMSSQEVLTSWLKAGIISQAQYTMLINQVASVQQEDVPSKVIPLQSRRPPIATDGGTALLSETVDVQEQEQQRQERPVSQVSTGSFSLALSPELQHAYDLYRDGMSHREFARVLSVKSHVTAGSILQRLKDKGYVDYLNGRKLRG